MLVVRFVIVFLNEYEWMMMNELQSDNCILQQRLDWTGLDVFLAVYILQTWC